MEYSYQQCVQALGVLTANLFLAPAYNGLVRPILEYGS